ncbi:DUF5302 domain-containing protein [Propioniciclava tarda]|uniref:DUF5302 domain-containing protein n=1 Tax=Propioniciclava tarda TaxID=433330 RepID=A0A4Q9KNU4_PROTD|nr:DUF5302 domain-containing protein [Propioniciclava tarda]TBT96277.1 hypothetical protein ET996_01005 [Propioniciclava tarda]SMO34698.1 hypothetical protein SAMN06266982_101204 [Propioniciclava tarda]HOA88892.1 DUF5302 domain-containing protein [Propioniciclava tarda]HQA31601.1 DUF5302 domain-containing protein [Propioniciclava tarda]HQD61250.1 DUF5302 domain-containing protein [Propioniciclava tarda]
MSEPEKQDETPDPKEAMRKALEAKKTASKAHNDAGSGPKSLGATSKGAASKRQFRRKSGG